MSSPAWGENVKTIFNPFTGKPDYITKIDSNTIQAGSNITVTSFSTGAVMINGAAGGSGSPGGSTGNLQYNNSGSFGGISFLNATSTTTINSADMQWVRNIVGPVLTDSRGCQWREVVGTTGILSTALVFCPTFGFIQLETGSHILTEDGSTISVEF